MVSAEWTTEQPGIISLMLSDDKCSIEFVGHIGNSVQLNLWYQPTLKNKPGILNLPRV